MAACEVLIKLADRALKQIKSMLVWREGRRDISMSEIFPFLKSAWVHSCLWGFLFFGFNTMKQSLKVITQRVVSWGIRPKLAITLFHLHQNIWATYQGRLLCFCAVIGWLRTQEVVKRFRGYHDDAPTLGINRGDGCSGLTRPHYRPVGSPVWNLWSRWSLRTN